MMMAMMMTLVVFLPVSSIVAVVDFNVDSCTFFDVHVLIDK